MRELWKPVVLVGLLAAPQCSTDPPCSNHSEPHATFEVAQGCAGYYCAMTCDPGWVDCNDGCNTSATVGCPRPPTVDSSVFEASTDAASIDAGEPTTPHRIAALSTRAHGLVVCGGGEIFMDGDDVRSLFSSSLAELHNATSPATPADGLTCDGTYVYWATLSTADASTPNGALYRTPLGVGPVEALAIGIDPLSGIGDRNGDIFVMTSAGLSLVDADSGLVPWMPAAATGAYKPFALTWTDTWSLNVGTVYRRADAGSIVWIDDAGMASALLANDVAPVVVVHAPGVDGGSSTSDFLATLIDDAGAAGVLPMAFGVHPIVATSSGPIMIVASDDTLYRVSPPNVTAMYTVPDHIVDVAVDGKWVVWTTSTGVWRAVIP